jgi:hypothetical protein
VQMAGFPPREFESLSPRNRGIAGKAAVPYDQYRMTGAGATGIMPEVGLVPAPAKPNHTGAVACCPRVLPCSAPPPGAFRFASASAGRGRRSHPARCGCPAFPGRLAGSKAARHRPRLCEGSAPRVAMYWEGRYGPPQISLQENGWALSQLRSSQNRLLPLPGAGGYLSTTTCCRR